MSEHDCKSHSETFKGNIKRCRSCGKLWFQGQSRVLTAMSYDEPAAPSAVNDAAGEGRQQVSRWTRAQLKDRLDEIFERGWRDVDAAKPARMATARTSPPRPQIAPPRASPASATPYTRSTAR